MRGMILGRSKCVVENGYRGIYRELKFKGTCGHVNLLPMVSATFQALTSLIFLPGVEARWLKRVGSKFENVHDYLT